jgi:pyruvate,orthophosphate dikinase
VTYIYAFDHPHDRPFAEVKALVGGKAAYLNTMAFKLGFSVPPAFTITTAACNAYLANGWPDGLEDEIRHHVVRIEQRLGRRFGDPADPLFFSVRSGAPVSMPGMMDTILNLGLNDATEAGLARVSGDPAFAADCHARFRKVYADIVGVSVVPEDPWEQLRGAVEAVFRSWNSDRARTYRAREGISETLGTGVTVQIMVFGNRGADSGTGVLFTRNPATGENVLYGDIMFSAQGEDVVAGTHRTEPISCLEERMPAVAAQLRGNAAVCERYWADCCDIEFTIEQRKLWMLQVRIGKRSPQAALRMAVEMAESPDFPLGRAAAVRRVAPLLLDPPAVVIGRTDVGPAIGRGLPASPGLVSGEVVLTPEAAVEAADAGRRVILVRAETSPDDVHGMARAVGILTATGGLASHAAVVARGWGIPAVVGAADVRVGDGAVTIGDRLVAAGDTITIDGATGEIFAGSSGGATEIVPEAAILLGWARDLGVPVGDAAVEVPASAVAQLYAEGPSGEKVDSVAAGPDSDDVIRALAIKGYATPEGIADALFCAADEASSVFSRLAADGVIEVSAGAYRLTGDGKALGAQKLAEDSARWGVANANAALDAFLVLDGRVKETVTAWQMREVDGAQAFNDHADPEYDAEVLGRLDALHRDAAAWLAPLVAGLPRLASYGERLERAAAAARGGDGRYVASPRVDSYHGAWFELHEDLILLAGRNRAEEVAAGRA